MLTCCQWPSYEAAWLDATRSFFWLCPHIFRLCSASSCPKFAGPTRATVFLTPYKIGIFGVNNEAMCHQVNYAIHESITTGKGPNAVASMLHHYLENYSLGESVVYIHADNSVGQNKNNVIMHYLCWRILAGSN